MERALPETIREKIGVTPFYRKLNEITKDDIPIAGGKGANLGEMARAGLPVPEGFVLLTGAYEKFIQKNDIGTNIAAELKAICPGNLRDIEEASDNIKKLFEQGDIPDEVMREIISVRGLLGDEGISVRSSATFEDLPGTSFAGQYSSYLNVKGDDIYAYIKRCWASLWNSRAISYRSNNGMNIVEISHAVVLQRMIKSDVSGILFTADPISGRRDQMMINSSLGLGEAIVGGEVTPDQWMIDKKTSSIIEENLAKKEKMSVRKERGVEIIDIPEDLREAATLDEGGIRELYGLALKVENHFGFPQDIEWAREKDKFYLVQTRPITSLFPIPEKGEKEKGLRIYVNMNLYSQAMKEPFTPMGEDIIRMMVEGMLKKLGRKRYSGDRLWWYKNIGGRLFIDVTDAFRNEKKWKELVGNPNDKDPMTSKALLQVLERNREEIALEKKDIRHIKKLNSRLLGYILRSLSKYVTGVVSPVKARTRAVDLGNSVIDKLKKERKDLNSIEDKLSYFERNAPELLSEGFGIVFYVAVSSKYILDAKKMIEKHLGEYGIEELKKVERAVPHSVTTLMGMELLKVAKEIDSKGKTAEVSDEEIRGFLEKYGHRSAIELDVGTPVWREDPDYVVELVNSFISEKNYDEAQERFERSAEEAERTILNIADMLAQKGRVKEARKIAKILSAFREMFGIREQSKFFMTEALGIFREILFDVGEDLVNSGRLKDKEDVFFVTSQDVRNGCKLDDIAALRKEEYGREMNRKAPRIIISSGECIYAPKEEGEGNRMSGIPVSPGTYEGRVKILLDPDEGYKLENGDILVTNGINPSWTPMFLKIGALIMETGGPISHGSVVAREYGIPAVAGLSGATTELIDGQKVKVNGETGMVELL